MRRTVLICIAAIWVGAVPAAAQIREVQLRSGEGLAEALSRSGCDPNQWFFPVILDNNIDLGEVRQLPVGKNIFLPPDCSERTNRTMQVASRMLLGADARYGRMRKAQLLAEARAVAAESRAETAVVEATEAKAEAGTLRERAKSREEEFATALAETNRSWESRLDGVQTRLTAVSAELERRRNNPLGTPLASALLGGGVALGAFVAAFVGFRRNRGHYPVRMEYVEDYMGRQTRFTTHSVTFANGSPDVRLRCHFVRNDGHECSEHNIEPQNRRRHIFKVHKADLQIIGEEVQVVGA